MAYQNNIPLATDKLSQSQGDINGNFQALGSIAGITAVANSASLAALGTAGFNFLYLQPQGSTPPPGTSFVLGNNAIYSANYAYPGPVNNNEIYVTKRINNNGVLSAGNIQIPASAALNAAKGFSYLPSGIIIQWGHTFPPIGNGSFTDTFALTFPNNVFSFSIQQSSVGVGGVPVFSAANFWLTKLQLNTWEIQLIGGLLTTNTSYYWMAIGN